MGVIAMKLDKHDLEIDGGRVCLWGRSTALWLDLRGIWRPQIQWRQTAKEHHFYG